MTNNITLDDVKLINLSEGGVAWRYLFKIGDQVRNLLFPRSEEVDLARENENFSKTVPELETALKQKACNEDKFEFERIVTDFLARSSHVNAKCKSVRKNGKLEIVPLLFNSFPL